MGCFHNCYREVWHWRQWTADFHYVMNFIGLLSNCSWCNFWKGEVFFWDWRFGDMSTQSIPAWPTIWSHIYTGVSRWNQFGYWAPIRCHNTSVTELIVILYQCRDTHIFLFRLLSTQPTYMGSSYDIRLIPCERYVLLCCIDPCKVNRHQRNRTYAVGAMTRHLHDLYRAEVARYLEWAKRVDS